MSDNRCISCGCIIPEGIQVCSNCMNTKRVMNWVKEEDIYKAVGNNGKFTIYKRGTYYVGNYQSFKSYYYFYIPKYKLLSDAKAFCENNIHWELNDD